VQSSETVWNGTSQSGEQRRLGQLECKDDSN